MKKKPFLIILCTAFLTIATPHTQAQEIPQEHNPFAVTMNMLLSHEIISSDNAEILADALNVLTENVDNIQIISGLALEVTDKVVHDHGNLQFIMTDIETLARDEFSSKLGNITIEDIIPCKNMLSSLANDMEMRRPNFKDSAKPLTLEHYIIMLNANKIFLTGEEAKITTIADAWTTITNTIKQAYPAWNAKYQELVDKVNSAPDKKQEEILTNEELKFAKIFSRVKLYYYMLGPTVKP